MNKKQLITGVIIIGLGLGVGWSFIGNHTGHMQTDSSHNDHLGHSHSMHQNDHQSMKSKKMVVPDLFRSVLDKTFMGYFSMQHALSKDSLTNAKKALPSISETINKQIELSGMTKTLWQTEKTKLNKTLMAIQKTQSIKEARLLFESFSMNMEVLAVHFGGPKNQHIAKYHCQMVDGDRGASWLQNTEGTQNPYFGSQMYRCGSKVKDL